ncbi:MAG: Gfo/Idh/MocA family oxidoreductase [Planctomycetes bacterium]|nr:Gfo/Idh/MocA family oxidoreductase [Planctomycetota bacterium]
MQRTEKASSPGSNDIDRRRFLAGAGGAALAFTIAKPRVALGTEASSKIKLGMIGCGSRATRVAGLLEQHGGFVLWAGADYFKEQVESWGHRFKVDPARRFSTLSSYKRLLECGVDAVAIESPPYFHPEQAAAAVDAGVHVYLAKPIAVDVPGCRSVGESGEKATAKRLCFLVDFQTRADPYYQEALRRVRQGDLGDFAFGESTYHAGSPWLGQLRYLRDDPKNPENRLRAWGLDRVLSGDIITEQNIHTLDVASWIMDEPPIHAAGTGGRKVREGLGSCWDHFAVLFQYSNNVGVTFSSRQFEGHGTQPEGIRNRMFGSKGVLETQYGGQVIIRGEKPYPGGSSPGIFNEGIVRNIATFHKNVTEGRFDNPTGAPSVRSNLVTLLGRAAAYSGERVRWEQLLKDDEVLDPGLRGLKA